MCVLCTSAAVDIITATMKWLLIDSLCEVLQNRRLPDRRTPEKGHAVISTAVDCQHHVETNGDRGTDPIAINLLQ